MDGWVDCVERVEGVFMLEINNVLLFENKISYINFEMY